MRFNILLKCPEWHSMKLFDEITDTAFPPSLLLWLLWFLLLVVVLLSILLAPAPAAVLPLLPGATPKRDDTRTACVLLSSFVEVEVEVAAGEEAAATAAAPYGS
jgi:anti-sigma factor RsiW